MVAYLQMGHQSDNLINSAHLQRFRGAILSPVNYSEEQVTAQARSAPDDFDTVFDPQLYFPYSERRVLQAWSYFPKDLETADLTSDTWWANTLDSVIAACERVRPKSACSPTIVPKVFATEFYAQAVRTADLFAWKLQDTPIRPLLTAAVGMADLSASGRALELASILTRSIVPDVYLVLVGDTAPRREFDQTDEIKGAMRLISALENAGSRVLVGFSCSDIVLWKSAGAAACAMGKFFNLRRFTSSRFEDPPGGGGQLAYWFEESMMAFLRETDLIRLRNIGKIGPEAASNPFAADIMAKLDRGAGERWVGDGWRQYLYSFADLEHRLSIGATDPEQLLLHAENTWLEINKGHVLMEEPENDGSWLRPWRRAYYEFADS
jgi:hypothetical protein